MQLSALPGTIDLAIIGAGPQALTLVAHLLQKRKNLRRRVWVFDPSGEWLSQWKRQFAAYEIPHLRSPAVHHPDPNPFALRKFAEKRPNELHPPYDLPGTQLFEDFCEEICDRLQLQERLIPEQVTRLIPQADGRFQLHFASGETRIAKRVVLATGNGQVQLPQWAKSLQLCDRLCHSSQVDLRHLHLAGEKILIVGGGLTSGHLAVGAIRKGANVTLMLRRSLQEKLFDADPGWLGPKYLKSFEAELSWEERILTIQQARNGGSMTPAIATQLRRLTHAGSLTLAEVCQVQDAAWQGQGWQVQCDNGQMLGCDRLWLATGSSFNANTLPLLAEIQRTYPTDIIQGLPILDENLRWPGCELFITGGLAALQLGPVARNLAGARMASSRIVPALIKPRTWVRPVQQSA
ncbi:FAD/NAD(P)-binding protein [Oscillatoria amoena NRMC-F 0135]|nr:FAD/NAD(P)-binding protein [Oscillatoria amoena NRMC-F 0135]